MSHGLAVLLLLSCLDAPSPRAEDVCATLHPDSEREDMLLAVLFCTDSSTLRAQAAQLVVREPSGPAHLHRAVMAPLDPEVRAEAVRALGAAGTDESRQALSKIASPSNL